jgi:hypothetical protein
VEDEPLENIIAAVYEARNGEDASRAAKPGAAPEAAAEAVRSSGLAKEGT